MDKYHILGDNGKNTRKKLFLSLLKDPLMGYIDGATDYCMLIPFAEEHLLGDNKRTWLAFLYGLSYSQTTAMRIFLEFPDPLNVSRAAVKKFWFKNKSTLYFNPDRRYLKNNDQVLEAIDCFLDLTEGHCIRYWRCIKKGGFHAAYSEITKHWRYFGPMGAYLFFDAVYGLMPTEYVDPESLDWSHCGKPVGQGMAHLLYLDELVPNVSFTPDIVDRFNDTVDLIQGKTGQPKILIESTLCAFRKLFKGTRYIGYYADRMMVECKEVEAAKRLPDGFAEAIWQYRKETIPARYLGELSNSPNWVGIRKSNLKLFLEEGRLT